MSHPQHSRSSRGEVETFGHCELTGKICFATKKTAKLVKGFMRAQGEDVTELVPYLCIHCEHFHLGHKRINGELVSRTDHRNIAAARAETV